MNMHNIKFCGEIRKIVCGHLLLSGAMEIQHVIWARLFKTNDVAG